MAVQECLCRLHNWPLKCCVLDTSRMIHKELLPGDSHSGGEQFLTSCDRGGLWRNCYPAWVESAVMRGFATALGSVFVGVILKDNQGAGQQDYNRRVVDHRGRERIPLNHFLTDAGQTCHRHTSRCPNSSVYYFRIKHHVSPANLNIRLIAVTETVNKFRWWCSLL